MIEIDGYRLVRQIGAGGMGVVYEAEQLNPRRIVAIKVLSLEALSPRLAQRLEFEAQVLAHLRHPGIAQVFEAGWFEGEGGSQPFFAMEYVRGEPLNAYVDAHRLSITERLALIAKICDAVDHAHRKGIIHRDLKPENILVDEEGQPKILDFGLARAVSSEIKTLTTCRELEEVLGTILYMSPEQTEGASDQIDQRSDVYSLGVLAYEMLTGEFPHSPKGRSLFEYVRALHMEDPRPAGSVNRLLTGDVDTILAKALMKEKEMRYRAAGEMGADIRRHLNDEPIWAKPATTFYQFRKFARRRRATVVGVCATFLALVAGLIGTTWQAKIANDRLKQAIYEQMVSNFRFADTTCRQDRVFEAEDALLKIPVEYRHWEWGYLWRSCHREVALLRGHNAGLRDLAYNPAGDRIVSASNDLTARIWDVRTGECAAVLRGHTKRLLFARFSPDGRFVATASDDGTARLWTAEGKLVHVLAGHTGSADKARFSPDGTKIVTTSDDKTARIWNRETGECIAVLEGHGAAVCDAAFSPSGDLIATASDDTTVRIWDGSTGRPLATLSGHTGAVNALRFHPSGTRIASVSDDSTVRMWNIREGLADPAAWQRAPEVTVNTADVQMGSLRWAEFSGDGSRLIVASRSGYAGLCYGETGAFVTKPNPIAQEIEGIAFSRDGEKLILGSKDFNAILCPTFETVPDVGKTLSYRGHNDFVTCVDFCPANETFASGSGDGTIRVWSTGPNFRYRRYISPKGPFSDAPASKGGRLLCASSESGAVVVDCTSMSVVNCIPLGEGTPMGGWISPSGSEAIVVDFKGTATRWTLSPDGCLPGITFRLPEGNPTYFDFTKDGRRMLVCGPGDDATIFDTQTGKPLRVLAGQDERLGEAIFVGDGGRVVSITEGGCARLWDAGTGRVIATSPKLDRPAHVWVDPACTRVAVATVDCKLQMLRLPSLEVIADFPSGHTGGDLKGTYSPDGSILVTAAGDSVVRVWDADRLVQLATFDKDAGRVGSIWFSPDGRLLILQLAARTVIVLDAGPPSELANPSRQFGLGELFPSLGDAGR